MSTRLNVAQQYFDKTQAMLSRIVATQMDAMERSAVCIADAVQRDGIVYSLGAGHSLSVAAETYFRAGNLANCDVVHDRTFARAERLPGYAQALLDSYPITARDLLIVISHSGRNALPVEAALIARERGIFTIAITSLDHSRRVKSRAPQNLRLFEACDLVIDSCAEFGDAAVPLSAGTPLFAGPTSTIAGCFIVNSIIAISAQVLLDRGVAPPLFRSDNVDGGDEANAPLFRFLRDRIRGL